MIKGCQRKMIMVRGGNKSAFEMAYFVMRLDSEFKSENESDMIKEANRIINEGMPVNCNRKRMKNIIPELAKFLAGFISGGSIVALIMLILSL